MKSLKNDVKAWLIAMQRFRYDPIFNGIYVLHCRLSKPWFIQYGRGRKPI